MNRMAIRKASKGVARRSLRTIAYSANDFPQKSRANSRPTPRNEAGLILLATFHGRYDNGLALSMVTGNGTLSTIGNSTQPSATSVVLGPNGTQNSVTTRSMASAAIIYSR